MDDEAVEEILPPPLLKLLPPSELAAPTPSGRDGVSPALESAYRAFGCELIAEMCVLLRVPAVVSATAQTLLQRFYYRRSLLAFDAHAVAQAAVFLGAKAEESARRMRDILNVCYASKLRREGRAPRTLTLGGDLYCAWKARLIRVERFLLKDLGFNISAGISEEHPHKFVLLYVRVLGGGAPLAQAAWNFLNDSLRRDLCVRYAPEAIACAAIYLAARTCGTPLPQRVPWHEVFSTPRDTMLAIARDILQLHSSNKVGWLHSLRPGWVPADDEDVGEGPIGGGARAGSVVS